MTQINILSDKNALIESATVFIIDRIKSSIELTNRCTIALAGGSTPKPIYEAIAKTDLPWDKIHVFWGDERYVLPTDPDSNEKMAREAWLNKVNIPYTNIHPMPTDGENPDTDAQKHNRQILDFFGLASGFPSFDIVLLGMGDDGHTASLFPHTQALQVCDRLVTVGNRGDSLRLTFTVPLINQANCVIFLVAGSNKQQALKEVFSETGNPHQYPSKLINPQGELIWFMDEEASMSTNN
ncbi:6-phosphogluconolactonase [Geminocystis sp. NIES-3709]|uniref:6-phosphogluconolactonase n=1 Tax=Geminocystis sp. NIES-3709 TaxID=1617448 RepID=UPI0005FC7E4C|nr:6-phosphogluconolactonase [Geminocystis sp. NIES-3709]BAQ65132.1 6-phosphogluconolactonase [Geminocystis sp. NIES-3709]